MLASKKFLSGRGMVTKPGVNHYPYGVIAKVFSPTKDVQIHRSLNSAFTRSSIGKEC